MMFPGNFLDIGDWPDNLLPNHTRFWQGELAREALFINPQRCTMRRLSYATCLGLFVLVLAAASRISLATVIFDTGLQEPFFGWVGEDINPQQ